MTFTFSQYEVSHEPNGYWGVVVRFKDDIALHTWRNNSFHDEDEAHEWIRHLRLTLEGRESIASDFKASDTPLSGPDYTSGHSATADPLDRKDRST